MVFTYEINNDIKININAPNKYVAEWKFLYYYVPLYEDSDNFKFTREDMNGK